MKRLAFVMVGLSLVALGCSSDTQSKQPEESEHADVHGYPQSGE